MQDPPSPKFEEYKILMLADVDGEYHEDSGEEADKVSFMVMVLVMVMV